ncbi:auxin efflux carrier [Coniella lustricola]|uniref:Auxin efflux carrier n=1 Tax=Coniella lustricola TaxID=2025994 RepID=A0A2T3A0F9_9PEZI|nr:auxin efflux carrier [Coniella lustricola]
MAMSGLAEAFVGAIQASVSVLLVIMYGAVAAKSGMLTPANTKAVSKVCVRMFLPALLITKVGSELHAGSADRYGIIVLWALLCHFLSFLLGILGHFAFKMPDWVTPALMFNNTASYPLLLISALQQTGILGSLIVTNEAVDDAVERAKSYFLVFSTVSSCLTFAVGPRLIDTEHTPDDDDGSESDAGSEHGQDGDTAVQEEPSEETGLIRGDRLAVPDIFHNPFGDDRSFFPSTRKPSAAMNGTARRKSQRRASILPRTRWVKLSPRTKWWLLFASDFLNAPLVGAILGAVIGLVPALHRAFFNDTQDGGVFTAWLTASLKNIGTLFVPLPVVIAGTSLYAAYQGTSAKTQGKASRLPWVTVTYIMLVRFVLWPLAAIGFVYLLASKTSILGSDPMLWFAMMLMPCGPPAMKLITMIQVSSADDEEEAIIAKLLTISYLVSPILSFTVVGALKAAQTSI